MNQSAPGNPAKKIGTTDLEVSAFAERKGDQLLVTITVGSEKTLDSTVDLPVKIVFAMPKELQPVSWAATDKFIFAGENSKAVMDRRDHVWKPQLNDVSVSADGSWSFLLARQKQIVLEEEEEVEGEKNTTSAQPAKVASDKPIAWVLPFVALLNPATNLTSVTLSVGVIVDSKLDGTLKPKKFTIPAKGGDAKSPAILRASAEDTSALRLGQKFTLSWELGDTITKATLYGPISHDMNTKELYPRSGERKLDSIEVCVIGPMNFTLIANVRDENTPIYRTVTVGVLTDARGGRVDVWPRQVLPRGPVALLYRAHQVTSFAFHDVAGDVLDGETDGAPMPHDTLNYEPSNENAVTDIVAGAATLSYGPRAGQSWSIEAECQPDGDSRQLTATVTAVGSRKLPSSLVENEGMSNWSYLACDLTDFKDEEAPEVMRKRESKAYASKDRRPFAMAAGRFLVNKGSPLTQRWREWVAVATREGVDVHINKLRDQRAYRLDPEQHASHKSALQEALGGGRKILGIGSAEIVTQVDTIDVYRGECIVVVHRGALGSDIFVREIELPLSSKNTTLRYKICDHVGFTHAEEVQVVGLWPRLYVFGVGVAFSFDRSPAKPENWRVEQEPKLVEVCNAEWRIVAMPARPKDHRSHPSGGHLFALSKKNGRLVRFDVPGTGVITTNYVELAPASGPVAKLHRLRDALRPRTLDKDGKPKSAMALERHQLSDGRVVVAKDGNGRRMWQSAVNQHSVILPVGGALLVRSEVHDPLVQAVGARTATGMQRRGMQDRAYHPRLNLWVRCGHPFPAASTMAGAVLASTRSSLYCWDEHDEISYIAPIEASHLGFFPTNMAPMHFSDGESHAAGLLSDKLIAGATLGEGTYLHSPNGLYRLKFEKGGLELAQKDAEGRFSISIWTWKNSDPKRIPTYVALGFDANLVLHDGRPEQASWQVGLADPTALTSMAEHEATQETWFRDTPAATRVQQLREIRLVVSDRGGIACMARRVPGDAEEIVWQAPALTVGDKLQAGQSLRFGEFLVSANGHYRFAVQNNRYCLLDKDQKLIRIIGPEGVFRVHLKTDGELVFLKGIADNAVWKSTTYGGKTSTTNESTTLTLTDAGDLVVTAGAAELFRIGKSRLNQEEMVRRGEYIESPDGKCRLAMTPEGRVVLSVSGQEVWNLSKSAPANGGLRVQKDGNLVLYENPKDQSGALWAAHAHGGVLGGDYEGKCGGLRMLSDGFRVVSITEAPWYKVDNQGGAFPETDKVRLVYAKDGSWRAPTKDRKTLNVGEFMVPGDEIVSPNGQTRLVYEYNPAGNAEDAGCLKLIRGSTVLWRRGKLPYGRFELLQNGVLNLYNVEDKFGWSSVDDGYAGWMSEMSPILSVTDGGEWQIKFGDKKVFSSWCLWLKNGKKFLYVKKPAYNEPILVTDDEGSIGPIAWEFEGNSTKCRFRAVNAPDQYLASTKALGGTNLFNLPEEWKLEYFASSKTWSFYNVTLRDHMYLDNNNTPRVGRNGAIPGSENSWVIAGGLTPEGIREGTMP